MKRNISVWMLSILMLAALVLPAFADVMWEPYGNTFYESHRGEMEYENRGYLANGEKGYITVKSAPDSIIEVINLPNGTKFNVGMIWQDKDGAQWVVGYYILQTESGWEDYEGWVPMSELALIYDYIAFEEDHSGEFGAYDGSGDHLTEVCLYSYPNGKYVGNLIESKDYMAFAESFTHLYTDEAGKHWTFVGYYMGRNNAWVCLDDPLNEDLGTESYLAVGQVRGGGDVIPPRSEVPDVTGEEDPLPSEEQAGETLVPPVEEVPAAKTWLVWAIPAALIAAAAAATAVIVRKKNKTA